MTTQPEIITLPDIATIQQAAAERILQVATSRVAAQGSTTLVLAGGSTPTGLYSLLTQEPVLSQMPWQQMHILWGDERYVPHDDPDSNYRAACETLLDHVPIPPEQVYPVLTSYADPQEAAAVYHERVQAVLDAHGGQIDLLLLGMGQDGHIASLFPQHPALAPPGDRFAVVVEGAPRMPSVRVSLTAAAFNRAAHVLFLVAGADKAAAFQRVRQGSSDPRSLPALLVCPPQGSVTWLIDQAAAGQ